MSLSVAKPSPLSGELLSDRYEVLGFLDSGATADIYLAFDHQESELVSLKQLKRHLLDNDEIRERFFREGQLGVSLDHPHLLRTFAYEEPTEAAPFLVMEAVEGESLGDFLRREGTLAPVVALSLVKQMAEGLAGLHEFGIVHCDIKPDNVFLVGIPGAPEFVKLLDFGMSAPTGQAKQADSIAGTAQYMAPEQILAEGVDARTDLYALGIVLFRMLTGHLPFDLEPGPDLLRHQLFSPVPPLSWFDEHIDPRLEALVVRMVRKNPQHRFQSMEELLSALRMLSQPDSLGEPSAALGAPTAAAETAAAETSTETPAAPETAAAETSTETPAAAEAPANPESRSRDRYLPRTEQGRRAMKFLKRGFYQISSTPHIQGDAAE